MNFLYDAQLLIVTVCISASAQFAVQKDCQTKLQKCFASMQKHNEASLVYCIWAKERQ
jgi:hypothetical protein